MLNLPPLVLVGGVAVEKDAVEKDAVENNGIRALGWQPFFATGFAPHRSAGRVPGRVIRVDRDLVTVGTARGEIRARMATALARAQGPAAVGDWIALAGDVVADVLPRQSAFIRRAAGERTVADVVAANVTTVFVVAALEGRARPRKLERYLAAAWQSGARPVVVLTKADLSPDVDAALGDTRDVAPGVPVHAVCATAGTGIEELDGYLVPAATLALVGPSGAGKSTLANALGRGTLDIATGAVRADGKGRHTTTHRELFRLPGGALLIDTPGLRGLALWEAEDGLGTAFTDVADLAAACRFTDCAHGTEPGCAVTAAVDRGELAPARLANYDRLQREQRWLASRLDARVAAESRRQVRNQARALRRQPHR